MFLDRLICRWKGHAPRVHDPAWCSRCGDTVPGPGPVTVTTRGNTTTYTFGPKPRYVTPRGGLAAKELLQRQAEVRQRCPMLPWWYAQHGATPPGWVEPTGPGLLCTRRAEYEAGWNRIFERRKGER